MRPFSVCIIAKNEEKYIERCLQSIQHFNCEILVIDTGSTDRTIEIAKKYASKVLYFEWVDDFSAARNFSISQASYDWVLILDCDEWVQESDPENFLTLANEYPSYIGLLKRINLMHPNDTTGAYTDQVERFFNRKYYSYVGTIHEQVTPLIPQKLHGFSIPLTILHSGYIESEKEMSEKHVRNMSLLKKELKRNPDNPYWYFQLGQEYFNQYDYATAIHYYEKVLTYDLSPQLEYLRLAVQSYGECLIQLHRAEEALSFEQLEETFGNTPDFHYLMGRIYFYTGNLFKAMSSFIIASSMNNPHKEGTNTYLSWYYIALINEKLGDFETSITFYQKCGNFTPAQTKLLALQSNILKEN